MKNFHAGFTLVDTIMVVSMTGILAGITLPVIQDAREEARQAACANRLVELATGSMQYEEVFGRMPPLTTGDGPIADIFDYDPDNDQNTGALAYILPFIGEQPIFDLMPEIATQASVFLGRKTAPDSSFEALRKNPAMMEAILQQPVSLICPSNPDYVDRKADRLMFGVIQVTEQPGTFFIDSIDVSDDPLAATLYGRTSYLPSLGGYHTSFTSQFLGIDISLENAAGPMRNRLTSIRAEELGDGAANTICWSESLGQFGEDLVFDADDLSANFMLFSPPLLTGNDWIVGTTDAGGLESIRFGNADVSLYWLIGSLHVGGNNVTMCDGSVRFVSNKTSRAVMASLGCGNDAWIRNRE